MGQLYHQDEKLKAILNLVNNTLGVFDIILADTLQRHTFMMKHQLEPDVAWEKTLSLGDNWIKRHLNFIMSLSRFNKFYRWDDWISSTLYEHQRKKTYFLIKSNRNMEKAINDTAESFVNRLLNNRPEMVYSYTTLLDMCKHYLIEECSVMPLWAKNHYNFEIYPGKRLAPMEIAHTIFVEPFYPKVLQWLRLDIRSYESA